MSFKDFITRVHPIKRPQIFQVIPKKQKPTEYPIREEDRRNLIPGVTRIVFYRRADRTIALRRTPRRFAGTLTAYYPEDDFPLDVQADNGDCEMLAYSEAYIEG